MNTLFVLVRTIVMGTLFLYDFLRTLAGFAIRPTTEDLLGGLDKVWWNCAHTVQDYVAQKYQVRRRKIGYHLIDSRLLRLANEGLVLTLFQFDVSCPHYPPCGEWFYLLSEDGKKKLEELRRSNEHAQTSELRPVTVRA